MPRLLFLTLFALLLSACAGGPVKRVFPPEARLQELQLESAGIRLQLRVQSFSTIPSRVQAYALTLEIAGKEAARLVGQPGVTLLPQAAEVLEIASTLDTESLARTQSALNAGTALRYRIHGTITVEPSGRAYPIDYSSALSPVPGLQGVLR